MHNSTASEPGVRHEPIYIYILPDCKHMRLYVYYNLESAGSKYKQPDKVRKENQPEYMNVSCGGWCRFALYHSI